MTIIHKIDREAPDAKIIAQAAKIIRSGGLVAFPTETVYGLGADALNSEAVKRIYEAKGRPSDNPLILHVCSIEHAESLVVMNDIARRLVNIFWPGPLTLVLPARPHIPTQTRGGLSTAAVRMPDNPTALALIHESGTSIAAPSANLSGRPSPTDAASVLADMNGRIDMILDGGNVRVGIESTVIDVTNPERVLLLRPGGMSRESIEHALQAQLHTPDTHSAKRSPGTRYRHYSPKIPVRIWRRDSEFPESDRNSTGYIGIHPSPIAIAKAIIFPDYSEYARELFSSFRKLEHEGYTCIIAEYPEEASGICEGLRDRILRAAMD